MFSKLLSKTFIKAVTAIFVAGLVVFTWAHVVQAAITNVTITPTDNIVGHDSAYDFSFDTDVVTKTKTITITFPSGYEINNGSLGSLGDATDVICSNNCDWDGFVSVGTGEDESLLPVASVVQISTRVLKISLNSSADLSEGTVYFHINDGYIRNPYSSGNYNITVKTGTDTTPVSDTVTIAADNNFSDFENYGYVELVVNDSSITADETATFTLFAHDQYGNNMGDVTGDASFDITEGAGGSFINGVYSPQFVGEWLVTATYGGHSDSEWIDVTHGAATSLYVEESVGSYYIDSVGSSVYPGGSRHVYSIYRDQFNNYVSNPAVDWTLINKTGGVVDGDLVADGDDKGAVFTGNLVGSADIHADDGSWGYNASIDVISYSLNDNEHFGHITVTPDGDTFTTDQTKTFSVEAFDDHGNSLGDVTGDTTFSVVEGNDEGYFDGNTYHPSKVSAYTVRGNYNGYTDDASINVQVGAASYISIDPSDSEINAGATESYSVAAYDAHNNLIGDVTGDSTFEIVESGHNGSFTDDVYTSSKSGTWTVRATYGILTTDSTLEVIPGAVAAIVMGPDTDTISVDDTEAFTVNAYDAESNLIGEVTMSTNFSITGGNSGNASMIDNLFSSEIPDTYTVEASYSGHTDTSSITVTVGSLDHFEVTGITDPIVAGVTSDIVVTAKDQYDNTISDYQGTVTFSSSDVDATLPGSYSFQEGDNGTKTFTSGVMFETAGEQSVTVADFMNVEISGSQDNITVRHGVMDHFTVVPSKTTLARNENFTIVITAEDVYGNTMSSANGGTAFTGLVTIDTNATLPNVISNSTTFVSGDNGVKTLTGQSFGVDQTGVIITAAQGEIGGESDTITVSGVLAAPGTNVVVGTYYTTKNVTLTASGASSIHYTVDGVTEPTCSTGSTTFPISVSSTKIIKAIACHPGGESAVVSFSYVINAADAPISNVTAGTYTSTQSVTLSATNASSIHYMVDGSTPTCSTGSTTFPISISSTKTVKAVACYPGSITSSVAAFTYTIRRSSGGGGGGGRTTTTPVAISTVPVTTPVVTQDQCSASQILSQNLHAPSQNGKYNSYTGAIVTEAKILQAHLNRLGFNSGPVDGFIGPLTDGAIKRMQVFLGTTPDGYVGPITRGLLNRSCGTSGLHQ